MNRVMYTRQQLISAIMNGIHLYEMMLDDMKRIAHVQYEYNTQFIYKSCLSTQLDQKNIVYLLLKRTFALNIRRMKCFGNPKIKVLKVLIEGVFNV